MNNSEGQTQEPVGGMKWVKASDRLPEDNDSYHIQYEGYKDIAYCESGEWYNAGTDNLLPKAFVNNLQWLDENYTPPPAPIKTEGEDEWKDVDSAPKDRTEILGYDYNTESIYIVLWCPVLGNGAWILPTGNYLPRITHWRPLPNKPGESGPTPNELNLLKETVNNQHALILSAEQRGYEKAKQELSAPPSPVGIGVEVLAEQKAKERYPGEMNMMGYKINAQKNNQEKFIKGFKAGYAASLPQSSNLKEGDWKKKFIEWLDSNRKLFNGLPASSTIADHVERYVRPHPKPLKVIEQDDTTPMDNLLAQSSTEEEKDLWLRVLEITTWHVNMMSKTIDVISQLKSKFKISKK